MAPAVVVGLVLLGCTAASEDTDPTVVPDVVAATQFESTDFCRRILDLERSDPSLAEVIGVYRELLPTSPPEIAAELALVLADLSGEPAPISDAGDEAGTDDAGTEDLGELDDRVPAAEPDPAQAMAAYVDDVCRATVVNPLPGPTDPE